MDVLTSRKETRYQSSGAVQVLMDNITDLYPKYADPDELLIADVETIEGDPEELLDRAMWAVLKQRGGDPLNLTDGNQIEETVLGEVSPVALISQITASVAQEGPGVQVTYSTQVVNGKELLSIAVVLVPAA